MARGVPSSVLVIRNKKSSTVPGGVWIVVVKVDPRYFRPAEVETLLGDSTKARTTLGWQDAISLDQGIDETIAWISRNLEELKQQPADYIHKP